MKKATIADVAVHAGVSKSTVSQFLNKRYEYMSEDTRQKIAQSIAEMHYRPNVMARSLKQKSTYTIGVIVANIMHDFSTKIIRSLEAELEPRGFHMIVCNADDKPIKEKNQIETLLDKQVDGLIIFPTGGNQELYEELLKQRTPIVFMDRFVKNIKIPSVLLNNEAAIELAMTQLENIRPVAIVTTSIEQQITPRIERLEGFRSALVKRLEPIDENYICSNDNLEDIFRKLLELPMPPKGIIAANDRVLNELLRYLKKQDVKIDENMAIVCIDEVSYADFTSPSITTVSQPSNEMAKKAASLLLLQIDKKLPEAQRKLHRFEPTLHIRASSK